MPGFVSPDARDHQPRGVLLGGLLVLHYFRLRLVFYVPPASKRIRSESRRGEGRRGEGQRDDGGGGGHHAGGGAKRSVAHSPAAWHALKKLAREAPPVQTVVRMWFRSIRDLAPLGGVLFEPCPAVRHGCHLSSFVVLLLARSVGRSVARCPRSPSAFSCLFRSRQRDTDRSWQDEMKNLVGMLVGWVGESEDGGPKQRENRIGSASQA